MYTAALVLAMISVVGNWVRAGSELKEEKDSGVALLVGTALAVWMFALLVGLARYINGDISTLSGWGF